MAQRELERVGACGESQHSSWKAQTLQDDELMGDLYTNFRSVHHSK